MRLSVRLGETTLQLWDRRLTAITLGAGTCSVELEPADVEAIWKFLESVKVPLVPDRASAGVGGRGSGLEISSGMSRVNLAWWMTAPTGWEISEDVFWKLAAHLPREVRSSYLFARGSE
jgi:hypothetical protein